jgi:hypothetical protein
MADHFLNPLPDSPGPLRPEPIRPNFSGSVKQPDPFPPLCPDGDDFISAAALKIVPQEKELAEQAIAFRIEKPKLRRRRFRK